MSDLKYVESRLAELAEILEQSRTATLEAMDCLANAGEGSEEPISRAIAMIENVCDEIAQAHRNAMDVLDSLSEEEEEET